MVFSQDKNDQKNNAVSVLIPSALTAQKWVSQKALPFWASIAQDEDGGFCEELNPDKSPNWQAARRLRVQARQIYTYALARDLTWFHDRDVADKTLSFMFMKGRNTDINPGFIHLLNSNLSVMDARRDLYDHAFYLLALGWHGRTTGDQNSLQTAKAVMWFLDNSMKSRSGGWIEGLPQSDPRNYPRRQNPHMHLLEAFMALFDATGDGAYLKHAEAIYDLFVQHFFDEKTNTVTEYFEEDWTPISDDRGLSVEPGHAAEWVWLLSEYQKRTGTNTRNYADALYTRLLKPGSPYLNDEEHKDGHIVRATKRLWVQTEWVKAHLSQLENKNKLSALMAKKTLDGIMRDYLKPDGSWNDQLSEDGDPIPGAIPTSTFYHILGMVVETCRIAGLNSDQRTKRRVHVRS